MKNRFVLPALTATAVVGNLVVVPAASAADFGAEGRRQARALVSASASYRIPSSTRAIPPRRPATWPKLATEANPTWPKLNGW